MSYILEALKKSEQERQIGHVPDLSVIQESSPRSAAPRWPRWLLAALLANVALLVVLAWRGWDARMSANVTTAPSASTDTAATAQSAGSAAPAAAVAETAPAPVDSLQTSAPVHEENAAQNGVAAPELPQPVSQMPMPAAEPVELMQPAADAQAQLGPDLEPLPPVGSVDAAAAVPRWEDLPAEQRGALPVPRIDVHVFAQEPERRFVLVNLRKYKQGDTLEDGTVIETILADGIVLSYQGQQYRVDRP